MLNFDAYNCMNMHEINPAAHLVWHSNIIFVLGELKKVDCIPVVKVME